MQSESLPLHFHFSLVRNLLAIAKVLEGSNHKILENLKLMYKIHLPVPNKVSKYCFKDPYHVHYLNLRKQVLENLKCHDIELSSLNINII